jgi:hypothetical protein
MLIVVQLTLKPQPADAALPSDGFWHKHRHNSMTRDINTSIRWTFLLIKLIAILIFTPNRMALSNLACNVVNGDYF